MLRVPAAGLLAVPLLLVGACRGPSGPSARASIDAATPAGLADFAYHDFGALTRAGFDRSLVPWKLSAVGLLQRAERARGHALTVDSLPSVLREYGFLDARQARNWMGPVPRELPPALGLLTGPVPLGFFGLQVEGGGIGCAACHSSTLYDASGRPTLEAWIGAPSRAIYLEAYVADLFAATEEALRDPKALLARIEREYPGTGWHERFTLRRFVIPSAKKRFRELRAAYGGAVPFYSGSPGHTNGVAAIKFYLAPDAASIDWSQERALVGIPDLYARHLRSAVLVDGVYSARGGDRAAARTPGPLSPSYRDSLAPVIAFFAVPALGVPPATVVRHVNRAGNVLDWLTAYRPPRFPGPVDATLAAAGAALYTAECASCHGAYASTGAWPREIRSYPNHRVPIEEIGTDAVRLQLADDRTRRAIERSPFGPLLSVEPGDGYVAPMLNGVWMRAPYLHNGSVPTVWHLLTPDARPAQFEFGGHALDYDRLGIALEQDPTGVWRYPSTVRAWSRSALYDTQAHAQRNSGHRYPARALSELEKRQLIEYLKTL